MIPDNVTLVVKAPNQQIDDQNVECRSSWTVKELKGHLSEVYPSKPRTEEQKIIYSGQLLEDNTILKDVLRSYESQIIHTMHLVCTPTRRMPEPKKIESPEGLRRRNVEERVEARPETRQNDQNHTVEMQNYLSSFVNNYGRVPSYPNYNMGNLPGTNDPASYANHIMMMQQAYLQYMQQYANMWQATANTQPINPVPEAPPQPVQEAPPQMDEGDDLGGRDWLDNIYAASRLGILFSLVYLYGSPARLLLVLVLVAALYLYQIGFFRDLNANQNNVPQVNAGNPPQNAGNPPQNAGDQPANAGNLPQNGENRQAGSQQTVDPPAPRNDESILGVTRMIFTSFFASLIPDVN